MGVYAIISELHVDGIIIIINHKSPTVSMTLKCIWIFLSMAAFFPVVFAVPKFPMCKSVRCGECGTLVTHCIFYLFVCVPLKHHMCSIMSRYYNIMSRVSVHLPVPIPRNIIIYSTIDSLLFHLFFLLIFPLSPRFSLLNALKIIIFTQQQYNNNKIVVLRHIL